MAYQFIYIVFFVIYFSAIIAEDWYSRKNNLGLYEKKDSFMNLGIGILVVITRLLLDGFRIQFWFYLASFALFEIGDQFYFWILLFIGNELTYYWFHRFSHENKFLWAVHVNHHSSTRLNLLTSARLPVFAIVVQALLWAPLVLLGFNPLMIFLISQIGFIFATFQHLRVFGKLGWAEKVFNTPTHHAIHHASNKEYINHNYGLALIVFDKLFGTFVEEKEEVEIKYGITNNIETNNPLVVIFHEWINIFKDYKQKWTTSKDPN